ncbi:hypothetical protein GF359_08670, partial [candidate division WOR-3 bacterium]|nr:hypothetical protein [candidate division WOR-3 bacterium]MBD3365273.1 hypothetical protein [candidate division WOR-3 bacterium]
MMQGVIALIILLQTFDPIDDLLGTWNCYGVSCADLDTNGTNDIILACDEGIVWYPKNLDLSFQSPRTLTNLAARAVLAGNLDGDRDMDIFVATPTSDFIMQDTTGKQDFKRLDYFDSDPSYAAAFTDFDNDGDLDIFVAGAVSRLYRNEGDASFTTWQEFEKAYAVSFADYNSDGNPDFALAVDEGVRLFKFNINDSMFYEDVTLATSASAPRGLCWFSNGEDSLLDLVVADSGGVNLWIENTSSGFTEHTIDPLVEEPTISVLTGDFDKEQGQDILFINYGTVDRVYYGNYFDPSEQDSITSGTDKGRTAALAELEGGNGLHAVVAGEGDNAIYKDTLGRGDRYILSLHGRKYLSDNLSAEIAPGARITLYNTLTDSREGLWEITAGSGHSAQNTPQIGFALPEVTNRILEVYWPRSGVVDSSDMINLGNYEDIEEDMTSPVPPSNLASETHIISTWSNDTNVVFSWVAGFDPHGSGLARYSTLWSNNPDSVPDGIIGQVDPKITQDTFPATVFGDNCYFSIVSVDNVGNVSAATRSGPFQIDPDPPVGVEPISPKSNTILIDPYITYKWSRGSDPHSGIEYYHLQTSFRSDFIVLQEDTLIPLPEDSEEITYQSAVPLEKDTLYYWKIQAADSAGNICNMFDDSFYLDTKSPVITWVAPEQEAPINTLISVQFDETMYVTDSSDPASTDNPGHYEVRNLNTSQQIEIDFDTARLENKIFDFKPREPLPPSTNIQVTVKTSVRDLAGNHLDTDYTWDFRTGEGPDTKGPAVQSVALDPNPTRGEKKVAVTCNVSDEDFGGSHVTSCGYVITSYDTVP